MRFTILRPIADLRKLSHDQVARRSKWRSQSLVSSLENQDNLSYTRCRLLLIVPRRISEKKIHSPVAL